MRIPLMMFLSFLALEISAQKTHDCITSAGAFTSHSNGKYTLKQCVGQGSPVGVFSSQNGIIGQGFLHPIVGLPGANDEVQKLISQVYPNPTTDILYIALFGDSSASIEIHLSPIDGKMLKQVLIDGDQTYISLDLSDLAPAVYLLSVVSEETTQTLKIQKAVR